MTSLARQLERLAIPGQPSLKQLVSKKRPSLLFERKEAADIDIETFYSLGRNGLEELISIDPTFSQFQATLFQESCKEFERSVQTSDVLVELDGNVSVFLRRLSPYFLLKPAQKCLEWLVQAYRVTATNADDVIECALPYYETRLFARVVQLLPLKSSSSPWHWLRPLQKAGSPLSRLSLVQHCISVPAFLVFLCEMVPRSITVHKRSPPGSLRCVLSLYCSTVTLVLDAEGGTSEEIVGRLLPYLLKGLKSRMVEWRTASYIIAGQLASKTTLDERVCTALLEAVTKRASFELGEEGVCCAAVVCHSQTISQLSSKTVRNMLRLSSLTQLLSSLSSTHNISSLVTLLLSALINAHFDKLGIHDNNAMETILSLLDEIRLEEHVVISLISELLILYKSHCMKERVKKEEGEEGEGGEEELKSSVALLAQSLDAKYPELMDKALQTALVSGTGAEMSGSGGVTVKEEEANNGEEDEEEEEEEGDDGEEQVKWIHEFVSSSLPGSRHQVVRKGKGGSGSGGEGVRGGEGTLVLSVHHPEPSVREAAVRQLGRALRHSRKSGSSYDSEFACSCLVSRLRDDDPSVVSAVLGLGEKTLCRHVPPPSLLPPLLSIITHHNLPLSSLPWQRVAVSSLSLLTSKTFSEGVPEDFDDIIIMSLPLLFVHRRGNKLAEGVVSVLCGVEHALLEGLAQLTENEVWRLGCSGERERDSGTLTAANSALIHHLGDQLATLEHQTRHKLVTKLLCKATSSSPDSPAHFMFVGILCVAMETDHTHSPYWLRPALDLLQYTRDCLNELARALPPAPPSPTPTLDDALRPLVRKRAQTSSAHSMLLLWLLDTLVTHLPVVEVSTEMWLSVPGDCDGTTSDQLVYHRALFSLFDIVTSCCVEVASGAAKSLLQGLLKTHLSNQGYLLRFLAMMWTAPVSGPDHSGLHSIPAASGTGVSVSALTQANSLAVFSSYLKCLGPEACVAFTSHVCPVVPSLLIPLSSPYQPIRCHALSCLSLLLPTPPQRDPAHPATPVLHLLDALVESELAISSDPSSLRHILGHFFHNEGRRVRKKTSGKHQVKKKLEKRVKDAVLDSILNGLLTHIVALTPPPHIQASLLGALQDVDSVLKVSATQPLLRQLLDKCSSHCSEEATSSMDTGPPDPPDPPCPLTPHEATSLRLCLASLTPSVASSFLETFLESSDTHVSFQLLLRALSLPLPLSPSLPSPLQMALLQVTPAFSSSLTADSLKLSLLNSLLSILVKTRRSEVAAMVKQCFMKLELSAELVIELISGHASQLEEPLPTPGKKKQRCAKDVSPPAEPANEQGLPPGWRAITVLLELLQDSGCSSITDHYLLTPHYFTLLSRCLQAEESERHQLEYTQQLLLGTLLSICSQLTTQDMEEARVLMPESVFNVELIVQCVRVSSNPLTHHHALLLLSSAAALYPSRVLHNIMPVFTFMGSSLLRSDNQYSFQVITQTLDSVIPALIQSGPSVLPTLDTTRTPSRQRKPHPRQQQRGAAATPATVDDVITEIVRVFVDAVPHVPHHRRLPLLSHLLQRVGPAHFLSVALGLLVAKHVEQLGVKEQTPKEAFLSVGFPVSLAQLFPVDQQLVAVSKLLNYVTSLPLEKPTSVSALRQLPAAVNRMFNVATHSQKQLLQFKCSSLSLASSLLTHRRLSEQLSLVEKESFQQVEETIHSILQTALDYETSDKTPTKQDPTLGKLNRTLVNRISDVIGHVTALLSPVSLVAMVMHLLCVSGEEVKVKALKIVSRKLEEGQKYFTPSQDECMLQLLSAVVGVAKNGSSHLLTRHSAVFCVKLIVRRLTHKHHVQLVQALQELLSLLSGSDDGALSSELTGGLLLAVAEISSSLGPQLIPLLPPTLPLVIERVGGREEEEEGGGGVVSVMVQTAAVTTLGIIVQTLPKFLSSFIVSIINELCQLERGLTGREDKERKMLATEAALTREKVATLVPPRILVPAYTKVYPLISPLGKGCLLALLEMLSITVGSLGQEDARNLSPQLQHLFSLCLDHRAQHKQESMEDLHEVEEKCVQAFVRLVVQLSESLFRPTFLKLLDWATSRGADEDRLISFYHLADGVAGKLKGLFLLFAGHTVKSTASLLQKSNAEYQECSLFTDDPLASEKINCLLSHLLSCLHKCFLYSHSSSSSSSSSSSFVTKERFDTLMQPLVHQVSNVSGREEVFQRRVEGYLCPCVAQLAVAAGREDLWKPLNHQLLLKTRHKDSQVRYAAVIVLKEVYSKLGVEFMPLLPETIPFIAELLEDENEEVEKETQSLISTMETQLGESIQQYFQ